MSQNKVKKERKRLNKKERQNMTWHFHAFVGGK